MSFILQQLRTNTQLSESQEHSILHSYAVFLQVYDSFHVFLCLLTRQCHYNLYFVENTFLIFEVWLKPWLGYSNLNANQET